MFRVKIAILLVPFILIVSGCKYPLNMLPSSPLVTTENNTQAGEEVVIRVVDEEDEGIPQIPLSLIKIPSEEEMANLLPSPETFNDMKVYTTLTDSAGYAVLEDIAEGDYAILTGWGVAGADKDRVPEILVDIGTGELFYPEITIPYQTDTNTITLKNAVEVSIHAPGAINNERYPILVHPTVENPITFTWHLNDTINVSSYFIIIWSVKKGLIFYYPDNPEITLQDTIFTFPQTAEQESLLTHGSYRIMVCAISQPDSINPLLLSIRPSEPLLGKFVIRGN